MARVATWIILILGYYFMLALFVACLSMGNMLTDDEISSPPSLNLSSNINSTAEVSSSSWGIGKVFSDLLDYSLFGLDLGLGGFGNLMVNFIFLVVPGVIFILLVAFAIRSGSS